MSSLKVTFKTSLRTIFYAVWSSQYGSPHIFYSKAEPPVKIVIKSSVICRLHEQAFASWCKYLKKKQKRQPRTPDVSANTIWASTAYWWHTSSGLHFIQWANIGCFYFQSPMYCLMKSQSFSTHRSYSISWKYISNTSFQTAVQTNLNSSWLFVWDNSCCAIPV